MDHFHLGHIDESFHVSHNFLYNFRVVALVWFTSEFTSLIYMHGVKFFSDFAFFTIWTLATTWFYFLCQVILRPRTARVHGFLLGLSHLIWSAEILVSIFFWLALFPTLKKGEGFTYTKWIMYSFHSFPLIFLSIDGMLHKGTFQKWHIYQPIVYTVLYGGLNIVLGLVFHHVVYPPMNYECKLFSADSPRPLCLKPFGFP